MRAGKSHPASKFSIADLLDATVDEAVEFLEGFGESRPAVRARTALKLLQEVGLGYLRLGQPINTLSGGESQRLKLVRHLAEQAKKDGTGFQPVPEGRRMSARRPETGRMPVLLCSCSTNPPRACTSTTCACS